ncbi:MAG: diguanylate cyclase [Lachnospiraceae bacterium]|nr:diguanylate cyclase [Lachnospiraceae bacterium]
MSDVKVENLVNKELGFPKMEEFEAELIRLMNDAEGEGSGPIIIALTDSDNFLRVNTDFGRECGDKVLIDTGRYLESKLPAGATIYRVSGDEFGIIFNNDMEKEDVFLFLEDVRKGYDVKLPDGDPMTISIGIAAAFEDATRVQELIRKAESALFRAKANGHNKIALAKEEKMVPKTSHYTNDQLKCLTKLSKREGVGEAILLREALDMLLKKYDI